MSLIPTWPVVVGALVIGAAAGSTGMHVWNASEIAGLNLKLAQKDTAAAVSVSQQSQAALKDLTTAAATINTSAQKSQVDTAALNARLDTINRTLKNAKPPALAADCKPGTVRVQNLAASAAAVDQAIARPVPGR